MRHRDSTAATNDSPRGHPGCGSSSNSGGTGGSTSLGGRTGTGGGVGSHKGGAGGHAAVGGGAAGGSAGSGCVVPPASSAWVEIPARPEDVGLTVTDSFAVAGNDLLFAGTTAPGTAANQLRVVRWNQGCWSQELSMPIDATADVASVHGLGPGDLWAVGGDLILHDVGQGWALMDEGWRTKVQLTPRLFGAPALPTFVRVRAASATDVWINETEKVVHWTGGNWTAYNFDSPDYPMNTATIALDFADIWIDNPQEVWVADGSDVVGNLYDPAYVRQFDGTSWNPFRVANWNVYSIWRSGATLWLATAPQPSFGGSLVSFTGGVASPPVPIGGVSAMVTQPFLKTLWGRADDDIWSAGSDVAQFDGASWTLQTDVPAATHSANGDGFNTFVGGDPNGVWLVTPGPHFFRKAAGP
ncbi:MAG: hypothetical protein ABUS79_32320 [Pseudomonadota bacterium]